MHRVNEKHDIRTHRPGAWAISLVGMIIAAAMSGSCFLGTATNLCETSDRRCSPGQTCAAKQDVCIEIGGCGDAIVSQDERCDDGNILGGDGCSPDCKSEEICGNGTTDEAAGESCDDGNITPGDGCSTDCVLEVCGNSIVDHNIGEVCDDGNAVSFDGCSMNCMSNEACGNNVIDAHLDEECEFPDSPFPRSFPDTADCDNDCTKPMCGDGHLNSMFEVTNSGPAHNEQCDTGMADTASCDIDCTFVICGDGYKNTAVEECDDGASDADGDGKFNDNRRPDACRTDCRVAFCGDGVEDTDEVCDDGNNVNTDACPDGIGGTCEDAICGDGFRKTQGSNLEECDNGPNNSNTAANACRENCKNPSCGDGVKDTGEDCDGSGCAAGSCTAVCTCV